MDQKKVSIAELMRQCGVKFGTSGARGLVEAMTDQVCYAYTLAFLQHLTTKEPIRKNRQVAIAGDFRPSSPRIMAAICRAVIDSGLVPVNCGFLPSPAVALFGLQQGTPSIMVTGSHIPDDRNGIKFNKLDGEILKEDEISIRNQQVIVSADLFNVDGMFISPQTLPVVRGAAYKSYVSRYIDFFATDSLKGLKIGLYEHSGVARESAAEILEALGADVTRLGYSDSFIPVDTEAIRPEDVALARSWVREHKLDSIVSTDGDGDRPLVSDEKGNWLRGDVAGILCAKFLGAKWVATPVSSNSAVEKCGWFKGVVRTRIGSPYVIAAMQTLLQDDRQSVVGYEANGGFLTADRLERNGHCLDPLPTRDALIVILSILTLTKESQSTVSGQLKQLPPCFTHSDRLKEFPTEQSQQILAGFQTADPAKDRVAIEKVFGEAFGKVKEIDTTDGLRITFEQNEVVHLRPSGNAPELRCYTEAGNEDRVREMSQICMNILEGWREK